MLDRISVTVAKRLCNGLDVSNDHYEACYYGIEALLHTVLSTMGLLFIGLCFHLFTETLIIVAVFYINQTVGGGFHATSHLKCFATMALFLSFGLLLCTLPQQQGIDIFLSIAALIALALVPLILHENKQYLSERTSFFIRRSHIVVGAFACVIAILALMNMVFIRPVTIGLILSAVSRLTAKQQASRVLFHQ